MMKNILIAGLTVLVLFTLLISACKAEPGLLTTQPIISSSNAAAAKLVFATEPDGAVAGSTFSSQPVVSVQDGSGNLVTDADVSVTIVITSHTGTSGAVLSGTRTVKAVNGVAAFTDLSINLAGQYYALTVMSDGLKSAISHTFGVTPGAPTRLIFYTEPVGAALNTYFGTEPVVLIEDNNGNVVTGSTAAVTLNITPGTGTEGAVLSGGTTVNAVNGVATFAYLTIDLIGSEYTLTVTSPGLISTVSKEFYITAK